MEEESMHYPGSARADLCSIRTAGEQDELAEAVRSGFSAADYSLSDDYPPEPLTSGIDRPIRLSTAAAVLAAAGIAAYVSYWHAYAVVRAHGESGITARLEPATIDGLMYASSMVVLYAARHRVPVPSLARWLLGLGIAATLTANMAQGWSHGPVGAVVAAWPAVGLLGSYELLVWLIRTSGTVEHRPPAGHLGDAEACRAAGVLPPRQPPPPGSPARASATHQTRHGGLRLKSPGRRPSPASGQGDQAVPDGGAVDDAVVAAYQRSAQAGNPLSERKLAQMFGRTSRRWARARIAEARRQGPV
jgi:Protein of unknown function (DUF2637)